MKPRSFCRPPQRLWSRYTWACSSVAASAANAFFPVCNLEVTARPMTVSRAATHALMIAATVLLHTAQVSLQHLHVYVVRLHGCYVRLHGCYVHRSLKSAVNLEHACALYCYHERQTAGAEPIYHI